MIKFIDKEGLPCNKVEEWKVNKHLEELEKDEKEYIVAVSYSPVGSDDYSVILACIEKEDVISVEKTIYI